MTEIISSKTVKIAKSHNCWGCMKKCPIGTEMTAVNSVYDGKISTAYWCDTCNKFLSTLPLWERDTEWAYGDLTEYDNYPVEIGQ